ncbi:MAG: PD-(D/E)XK nuclease family protein [Tannerella sp.]|nr:PD-(D/E)XK nuclease family protein [Tannerella sp.]
MKQIASLFYDRHGADINRLAFVFPNRRSGIFFRKYLSEIAAVPIFSPAVMTINDLFNKLCPKQQADRIKLLFMLYDVYVKQSGTDETFDNFVYWGEMILNDFDDVDKCLVDARQLFTNVTDLNSIDRDFSFLTASQVQAIRSFWSSFQVGSSESRDANETLFLRIWELLHPVYCEFRKNLAAENLAYEGMIYREVAENAKNEGFDLPYQKIVFIGLNALTKAEKELLRHLRNRGIADFYWDYASDKIRDTDNKASFFVKENLEMFPSEYELPEEAQQDAYFEITGVPSHIGQAKLVYPILEQLYGDKPVGAGEALQTAIVLADEKLLLPVLNSIPKQISRINVTIGYSLSGAPVASLMENLQSLRKNVRKGEFYHRDAVAVLRHKYVSSACPDETAALVRDITAFNRIYIPAQSLCTTHLLSLLFSTPSTAMEISGYLISVLKELNMQITNGAETDDADGTVDSKALEQEFIFHYYTTVNRMREMMRETKTEMLPDTYFRLLKQMTDMIRIPFQGEPLSGLQVMGELETRALDFENIIILSANEGVFPKNSPANSFIPYHLRRGFGLSTPEHQECIRTYQFYRMIFRAKRVTMLFDTRSDGLRNGETSRFVHQLRYHYKTPLHRKLAVYNISASAVEPFRIDKDDETMQSLAAYGTEKSLSASAINTYLDCPLKFYLSAVKGIREEETVSETIEHDTFGTILHSVMELAYKPFCGMTVTADLLKLAAGEKNMSGIIGQAFAKDYFHSDESKPLKGQTYLNGEAIRKYACKILEYDRSLTPFRYIDSERLFRSSIELSDGRKILVKGFIDRIDEVNGITRIADYKSGKPGLLVFDSTGSLFDISAKKRRKAIMQVFLYAWVYASQSGNKNIQPAVYHVRELFGQSAFDPAIRLGDETVTDFGRCFTDFELSLRACLDEIFDRNKPFTQTPVVKNCEYCTFREICGR